MMKAYCDKCGKEVKRDYAGDRLKRRLAKEGVTIQIEVIAGVNGTWNKGDVCLDCLLDAINNGEDMP